VFDRRGVIETVNPGATRILRLPLSAWRGRDLHTIDELDPFAAAVLERFETLERSPEEGERDHWQESLEFQRDDGTLLTLLARGAHLGGGEARLLVFDDITEVVSAQRSAAWAEVARRLAHEIKNPLTPIQLSAERLQHRLEGKLEGTDRSLLLRGVSTIVSQVQAMLGLVNEFRNYARLPAAQLKPLDLNALVTEVLALYGQAQDQGRLVHRLAPGLPPLLGDATQLRQVIHNLVQNALDAVGERSAAAHDGEVVVSTAALPDESGALRAVRLAVTDNGPGFAEKVLKRALEPYVTTKLRGTGLGLAVVKKIADEHGARLRLANLHEGDDPERRVLGARVSLSFSNFASAQAPGAALPATHAAPAADPTQQQTH
jgi:nitrogen fixation/metabolism regulation signal transduction histidine kinase